MRAEECLTQSPPSPPREREESGEIYNYKNIPNAASRTQMAWRGEELNIENHENRFADMERRGKADEQSRRGRPARVASEKRKTSEKANVFYNLTSWGAAGSRTSGSSAMLVQKVPHRFRGCGILPR